MLTTFNTSYSTYWFTFGIISAQDKFQKRVCEAYERFLGVTTIVDNILVYGHTKEEHDASLHAMLQRIGREISS